MRSPEEILESFQRYFIEYNSPLKDFIKYGPTYFILRAFAGIINEFEVTQDLKIEQNSLIKSKGLNLDAVAENYGFTRQEAIYAQGYVLIIAQFVNNQIIPEGTILSDLNNQYKFKILQETIIDNYEISILVEALEAKNIFLPAGTKLQNANFSNLEFSIGQYKDLNKQIQVPLIGGKEQESDFDFRKRILFYLNSYNIFSIAKLESILKEFSIEQTFYIYNNFPTVGYFTIYIETTDFNLLENIKNIINNNIPLGIKYLILPLDIFLLNIDINIQIKNYINLDINNLKNNLSNLISNYFKSLNIGSTILKDNLIKYLILNLEIETLNLNINNMPNILNLNNNQIAKLNDLNINITV